MKTTTLTAIATMAILGAVSLNAQSTDGASEPLTMASISASEAEAIASAQVPGAIMETEADEDDGRLLYEVYILGADGSVSEVEIDAVTGEVLEIEKEDEDEDDDHDDEEDEDEDEEDDEEDEDEDDEDDEEDDD